MLGDLTCFICVRFIAVAQLFSSGAQVAVDCVCSFISGGMRRFEKGTRFSLLGRLSWYSTRGILDH